MTKKPTSYYVALFDRASDGGFGVTFPDAPGCTSAGATHDEAYHAAIEALRDWEEVRAETGATPVVHRDIATLMADPDVAAAVRGGAAMVLVPSLARGGRLARAQITMDDATLREIDAAAARAHETRSAFLVRVAREAIMAGA